LSAQDGPVVRRATLKGRTMGKFQDECRGDIYDARLKNGFDEPVPDKVREQAPTKTEGEIYHK